MTSDTYQHSCGGRWQPFGTGGARYRCDTCFVIGLKRRLVEHFGSARVIDPYKCGVRNKIKDGGDGKTCSLPAVGKNKGTWMCHGHNKQFKETLSR